MVEESHSNHNNNNNDNKTKTPKLDAFFSIIDGPVTFFREKIIEPLRSSNRTVYYHRKYPRVPTIDECGVDDFVCAYEATMQMKRDRAVDKKITQILHQRYIECMDIHKQYDGMSKCKDLKAEYDKTLTNYFIKYGELYSQASAIDVYMKQKHRLIWQRRNPDKDIVGTQEPKLNEKILRSYDKDADL